MSQPGDWSQPLDPPAREPVGPTAVAVTLTAAAVAALGAPLGLLWAAVAPDVPLLVAERGVRYADPQPEQLAAADGWFALLAVPFGVAVAAAAWLLARRARGIPALVAVTVGGVGAGLLAWWLGRHVGLAGYRDTLAAAEPGAALSRPPDLRAVEASWWPPRVLGVVLVPALAAAAAYTLVAAWSRFPTLRPGSDEPAPGPRPDLPPS